MIVSGTGGVTSVVLRLGPFGGAEQIGGAFVVWSVFYGGACLAAAVAAFSRRDL